MTANDKIPNLIFFRDTPKDLLTRPPLGSSLQNPETSFLTSCETNFPNRSWDLKEEQTEKLFWKTLYPAWKFDCPICGDVESLVCELDDDELDNGSIRLKRVVCVHCSLVIPKNCPFLADELCSDQIEKERPKILAELGIECNE